MTKLNERRKIIFAKCENIMNVKYTYYVLERYSYIYIACMFLIYCACSNSGLKIIRYTINQKIGKWNNLNSTGPRKRVYNQYTTHTHNFETVKFNFYQIEINSSEFTFQTLLNYFLKAFLQNDCLFMTQNLQLFESCSSCSVSSSL